MLPSSLRRGWVLALTLCACRTDEPRPAIDASDASVAIDRGLPVDLLPPVSRVLGELHLHQFTVGAHAYADFVDPPAPTTALRDDVLDGLFTEPTASDGNCTLFVQPTCAPACAGATYCSSLNTCSPIVMPHYIDGGEIDVSGSLYQKLIRLSYDAPTHGYVSDPPPGDARLFVGGELLSVVGKGMRGDFLAPHPLVMTAPSPSVDLHFPPPAQAQEFAVRWQALGEGRVGIFVNASSQTDARSAYVRCLSDDTGEVVVPGAMMARLPPAPRDLRVEVERADNGWLVSDGGAGLYVHVSQTAWKNGHE